MEMSKKRIWEIYVIITFVLIYYSLLSMQGFSFVDSGWYATFYSYIYDYPESVEYNYLYWFTGMIGGLFVKLFPNTGLYGIRLLGAINVVGILIVIYTIMKSKIDRIYIYIGIIFLAIFASYEYPSEFYHNNFSAFMYVVAAMFLIKGADNEKKIYYFIAGIFLMINVFVRLPNVLCLILPAIIFIVYNKRYNMTINNYVLPIIAGYFIGFMLLMVLMIINGHFELYVNAVKSLMPIAQGDTENSHSLLRLTKINVNAYRSVLVNGSFLFVLIVIISSILNTSKVKAYKVLKNIVYVLAFLLFVYLIYRRSYITILYYFLLLSLFIALRDDDYKINILALISLFMLIVMPIGSDWSIFNYNSAIWLSMPVMFYVINESEISIVFKLKENENIAIFANNLKKVLILFMASFMLCVIYSIANQAFFDKGSRLNKVYSINNEKLKYIYTTKEKAKIVNDMLSGISQYINKGDYLIAYESIPMVYYMTETIPFLNDSWLINSASTSLEKKLAEVKVKNKKLPPIIRQKFETILEFGEPTDNYITDKRQSTWYVSSRQTRIFNQFIKENKYEQIWSNKYFVLYSANKNNR